MLVAIVKNLFLRRCRHVWLGSFRNRAVFRVWASRYPLLLADSSRRREISGGPSLPSVMMSRDGHDRIAAGQHVWRYSWEVAEWNCTCFERLDKLMY